MQPGKTSVYAMRSNVKDAQSVKMTFDEDSISFLMETMTNLYSDPITAPIREYSSNAWDSHQAAGVDKPIEVTLPTPSNPEFVVQDYGLGMSVDDIFNIYSKYGYSTKRESNVEIGMLGLGSKSGLTYTDQFTVTAVKDGVRAIAVVGRDNEGAGAITVIDTSTVNEPNGVRIALPVHDIREFNDRAEKVFRWWSEGSVLIDGRPPKHLPEPMLKVTDNIHLHSTRDVDLDSDYVVMGNVAYPLGERLNNRFGYGIRVVAYVDIGEVHFAPSREQLHKDKQTKHKVEELKQELDARFTKAVQDSIENAASHTEALKILHDWGRYVDFGRKGLSVTYKGTPIPDRYVQNPNTVYVYRPEVRRGSSATTEFYGRDLVNAFIVYGLNPENISSHNKLKIRTYMANNGIDSGRILIAKEIPFKPWSDGVKKVDWETIKSTQVASKQNSKPVDTFNIVYRENGETKRSVVGSVKSNKIAMVSPKFFNESSNRNALSLRDVMEKLDDYVLVNEPKNRWGKFLRDHPHALPLHKAVQKEFEKVISGMSDVLKEALYHHETKNILDNLPINKAGQIEDPYVRKIASQYARERDSIAKVKHMVDWLEGTHRKLAYMDEHNDSMSSRNDTKAIYDRISNEYPFIREGRLMGRDRQTHVLEYINALYAYRNRS